MQIYKANPPGRPKGTKKELTPEVAKNLLESFKKNPIPKYAASLAKQTPYHVKRWIEEGKQDANNEIDSIVAQFFFNVSEILAEYVTSKLNEIQRCPDNYRALTWILEKCFPDEFGTEAEVIKQIKDQQSFIMALLSKGANSNGEICNQERCDENGEEN